ncbi:glycosyltransferase [Algoriphagus formosus]|uniref:glycosyltransferase n=1 Tax=Algoriphagus formosus TaxID=2007308 RepID=UPI003F6F2D1F
MCLVVINNSGFVCSEKMFYITKTTGEFLFKLSAEIQIPIFLYQLAQEGLVSKGINDFHVNNRFKFNSTKFYNGPLKIFSYFKATLDLISLVRSKKYKFFYIFYPGNLPFLAILVCIVFNKKYGLYVRGEYNSLYAKYFFKKAKFINTVGVIFQKNILSINTNCNLIRPMVQFDFKNEKISSVSFSKKNEILFVGRIEKRKGIFEIINAAKKINEIFPDYQIRLIGSGNDIEEVKKIIEFEGISNVILNGPIFNSKELMKFYKEAKLFLFPSHDEGFPRVLYEAMLFKLPIITTFVGNIPGLMENNINCLRIDTKSADSIVNAVDFILSNPDLQNELIENGYQTLSLVFNDEIKDHSILLKEQLSKYVR